MWDSPRYYYKSSKSAATSATIQCSYKKFVKAVLSVEAELQNHYIQVAKSKQSKKIEHFASKVSQDKLFSLFKIDQGLPNA